MKQSLKQIFAFSVTAVIAIGCAKPVVIVQVADVQMGFAAAALAGKSGEECADEMSYELECLKAVVQTVNDICPDVVVFTGDQVNVAGDSAQWEAFADLAGQIRPQVKQLYLPGNHDVVVGRDGEVDASEYTRRYGADRFCYCAAGVKLVGVNTNLIGQDEAREAEQFEWLKSVLETKCGKDDVTLVFGHHPYFLNDIEEPDSYFPIKKEKRHQYFDLFAANGVDAVYAGHRHETFDTDYAGIPMKTTTSAAFQIGKSKPSVRVIVVEKGKVRDELRVIDAEDQAR